MVTSYGTLLLEQMIVWAEQIFPLPVASNTGCADAAKPLAPPAVIAAPGDRPPSER